MTGGYQPATIYFARLVGTDYVKIGLTHSVDVRRRLRDIERRSISRQPLHLIGAIRCPYWVEPRYLESCLHIKCRLRRTDKLNSTECFELTDNEVQHMLRFLEEGIQQLKNYYNKLHLSSGLRNYYDFFDIMIDNACSIIR